MHPITTVHYLALSVALLATPVAPSAGAIVTGALGATLTLALTVNMISNLI